MEATGGLHGMGHGDGTGGGVRYADIDLRTNLGQCPAQSFRTDG